MAKKATQKKEKQPTLKQQIQQQIVNYQVQQAFGGQNQQNGMQQLQAEYDKWSAMQNLQTEYDSWLKAQQPKASTPKVEPVKFATAQERKAQKELQTQKLPFAVDPERTYDAMYGKTARATFGNDRPGDSVNQIPGLSDYVNALKNAKNDKKEALKNVGNKEDNKKSYMDLYTEESLKKAEQDEVVRQAREKTNAQRIADTMFDVTGANQQNNAALTMPTYEPKQTEEPEVITDNRTDSEKMSQWLDPQYKLSDEEKKEAKEVAQRQLAEFNKRGGVPVLNSEEDRQKYANAVNLLNKTSGFTNAMTGALNPFLRIAKNVKNSLNVMGNQLQEGAANITDALGITNNAKEKAQQSIEQRQQINNAINESNKAAYENAKTQNPLLTTGGEIAGMIGMYGLTNPAFDGAAAALGATSRLGQFATNQVGQNVQDLALDTLPTFKEYMADGTLSDEEKKDLLKNVGFNAVGNLVPGLIGEGITSYRNAKAISNIAPDVDNVVRNATRQAEEAAANIDDLSKQIPQIENPVDSMNNQFDELMKQRPKTNIPDLAELQELEREARQIDGVEDLSNIWANVDTKGPRPYAKNQGISPAIENAAEDIANRMKNVDLPSETEDLMSSDLLDIYRMMDNMQSAAEATGDPKVMEKFRRLQDSMNDLEQKAFRSDNLEEINAAKKAADASRQAFAREMKKVDPSYRPELTGTRIGNVEFRRKSVELQKKESEELANSFIKSEEYLNTPGANPLQFFSNNLSDAERQIAINRINAELELNRVQQEAIRTGYFEGQMVTGVQDADLELKKLVAQRARLEEQLARLQPLDNADIINNLNGRQRNLANSQGQTPPPSRNTPIDDFQSASGSNIPPSRNSNNPPPPSGPISNGASNEEWKISRARTNTYENQGWGEQLPEKDYAYRVQHTAEQHEIKAERYRDSQDVASELLHKDYDTFDAADVKASMDEIQSLMDGGEIGTAKRLAERLAYEGREGGRTVQAFREYNKNTVSGALRDASNAQEDLVREPWRSRNKKKAEGNSRIARALADMGNKWKVGKNAPELTHDQIKKGVIAELEREVGSVETHFNDNDIEFLTQLAEDKSIPVWQITSEIEHKLNTGNWYTLDESIPLPRPTNRRLQEALNSLVNEEIRAEKVPPTLDEIVDQVRNTLGKESADLEGMFDENDINYLANLINEGAAKEEIANALDLKMATGSWGISDETIQQVNDIFKQISHYDPNSKQFVEGQAEAYRLLANEIVPNATPMEKFEAWRYLAMLGNPKTWIRNYVGNKTFNAVTGISNNIAAVAEAGIDKGIRALGGEGIQRTKSVLNPISDSGLIKACAEDADASRYRQIVGSKYEKMDKSALRQSKSVFNSKLAQFYEKVTDAGISDYKAVKKKFSTSLAGYLKANGYDTNIFKAEDELQRLKNLSKTQLLSSAEKAQMDSLTKDVAALNKARDFALKQAEYATFHEDNALAKFLTKASQDARKSDSTAVNALGLMIEGVVPFKKTPANVLKSGLEYSPLGAIDSIKRTGKLIYENTGKRAGNLADTYKKTNLLGKEKEVTRELAADVIDSWAKTLTGTGLTALGFYLYNKGILHSSDPDTKYQDQLEGHQNYSIEINGKSYTIDWAAPAVMPLMVGAEAAKIWNTTGKGDEDFYNNIDDYVAAANRIADPLIETSMLQGVKDSLETAANAAQYNENINIPALLAYNTVTGYATQGIPTLAGQIARTIDPTRRSTYTDKEGVAGVLDKQLKKQINKTPVLSTLNQPYVDTYGREQQNSPFDNIPANLAYQMLSPGYLSNINETDADKVSREAFAVNQNANTLPKWQSSIKLDGQRVSPEDYTAASRVYGQTQYDVRNALANDEWFNSLDGPAKEEIVSKINTMSEHVGKSAIDPEYESNSKPYNAYKTGGIPGLMDYFKGENDKSVAKGVLEGTDIKTNSNAGKAVVEAVSSGNMAKAEQIAKQEQTKLDAFDSAGVKKTQNSEKVYEAYGTEGLKQYKSFVDAYGTSNAYNAYSRYQRAKQQIPGLSATTFKSTYNRIDSYGDSNGSVSQKEMLEYLNSGDFTQEEANQLWTAYGNEWKKSVKKNKKGNWATSK